MRHPFRRKEDTRALCPGSSGLLATERPRGQKPTGKAVGRPPVEHSLRKTRVVRSRLNCLKSNPGWPTRRPATTLANVAALDGRGLADASTRFAHANTVARECDIKRRA